MTIASTPSLVKKSLFFIYLLNAPWLSLLVSASLATFVITQYGAHIPDVPSMHSLLENTLMTQVAAQAEDKDPGAVKILKSKHSIETEEAAETRSVRLLEKQQAEVDANPLIPANLKHPFFAARALGNIIPWPVYLFGIALLVSALNGIWFLFHSFMKGLWWGLACIFVPFAPTVFEFKYWREVKRPFEVGLFCSCLFGICLGTYFGVKDYIPADDPKQSFASQIGEFRMPPAAGMRVAAPDIVAAEMSASFFEAGLAAVANSEKGRAVLKSLVKKKGKSFEVSYPQIDKVKVDEKGLAVSNNRDVLARVLEAAYLDGFDIKEIRAQLAQTGQPAIGFSLNTLTGKETHYLKANSISGDETAALVLDLLGRKMPVVVSSKVAKETGTPEVLASSCYAVISADVETKEALLYNCHYQERTSKERLPGVEELGNGLVKVPFSLFPTYMRYIAYLDKW